MQFADRHHGFRTVLCAAAVCAAILMAGCSPPPKPVAPQQTRYPTLPPKQVPEFLKDTILARTDLIETEPKLVSGFGLVAHLHNTADNTLIAQTVRSYIIREMVKRGFGSKNQPGFEDMQPEQMLRSPTVSIVRVDGYIPPGARKGDRFDVQVSALPGTNTTSLAHGALYRTELKVNGAMVQAPGYAVDVNAYGEGSVFVNPAYLLQKTSAQTDQAKSSLRYGLVLNGGISMDYRPLILRLRAPQRSLARAIELLIEQRFSSLKAYQTDKIAAAKDEGIVFVQLPEEFHGDWHHFAGVMTHIFLETRPAMIAQKARELVDEAQKPDAPLMDISFCWEAIGTPALDYIEPLLTSDRPDIVFAAARAAAYIGSDPTSIATLVRIAITKGDPFQINAIQVLGDLPSSPAISSELRKLLDSDQNLVRIEAYKVLIAKGDSSIYTTLVGDKFALDIVPSKGTPVIVPTFHGQPRIAIIGAKPSLFLPAMFTAMDDQLSITSSGPKKTVTIFYRGMESRKPIRVESNPDIAEIAARLGGVGIEGEPTLNFSYGDVVAMLQGLSDGKQVGSVVNGQLIPAAFVMQNASNMQQDILTAPIIPDQGRPESDAQNRTGDLGLRTESNALNPSP
ncbi:MAG TPA: flagellar basal body P-ring protein FlgI [Tepidisphaeraceae bacterium]|jgi:hypothetical protein|nr:flagellar basal body P-ring protein FlgI [Tepidisphaeraceae bacterium]